MSNEASQYVPGFIANLNLAPQQATARLVHCVDADLAYAKEGKLFNADDIGADDDEQDVEERAPVSPESFADHMRRVGFFKAKQKGRFIENLDVARMMQDPTNTIMAGMMATKNRGTDRSIIATLFGASRNGETGETVTAFPASQKLTADFRAVLHDAETVAGSGDLPMTVGKIIRASTMLDQSEIEGKRYIGWTAKQKETLLATTAVTSSDYNQVKALVNGEINTFMGFEFVRSEQFPKSGTTRSCAAWIDKAIQHRERQIQNAWIEKRLDRSGRWYAYYEVERGGLRRYDQGVVQIDCYEA